MITLERAGVTITLPEDLLWADEFAWSPVSQKWGRSITGAPLIDVQVRTAGRSITLTGEELTAWMTRAEVKQLKEWASLGGQAFILTHNGDSFTVLFDHGTDETTRALTLTPVVPYSDPAEGDYYSNVTLRFFTI